MNDSQLARQWIQNIAVFLALVFAQRFLEWRCVARVIAAYVLLCVASAVILWLGDRIKADGLSRLSSLARGDDRRPLIIGLVLLLAPLAFGGAFAIAFYAFIILALSADLYFSRIVLVDVLILGVEFSLKAALGGWALKVRISPWLLLCTFLLALVVALGKRRNEMRLKLTSGEWPRTVLSSYSPKLLDQMLAVVTSSAFIAFAIYTVSNAGISGAQLYWTLPMVLYGILRYLYLVYRVDLHSGSEVVLLLDRASMINIGLWIIVTFLLVWP